MKKFTQFFSFLGAICLLTAARHAAAQYSITYQNSENVTRHLQRVCSGTSGSVIAAGDYQDSLHLGSLRLTRPSGVTAGNAVAFVGKMDAGDNWVWATQLNGNASIVGVVSDSSGYVYITGTFSGTTTFGSTTLSAPTSGGANNNHAIFVAKLNSSGTFVWAIKETSNKGILAEGDAIAVDASGNVYMTGTLGEVSASTRTPEVDDIYLAKYNSSGTRQWEKQYPVASGSWVNTDWLPILNIGRAIALDASGNIYLTGNLYGTVSFGSGSSLSVTSKYQGTFTAKVNNSGTTQWVKAGATSVSNHGGGNGLSLYVDGSSNVYACGSFSGTFLFSSSDSLTWSTTSSIGFLVKYSSSGALAWDVITADSSYPIKLFPYSSSSVGVVANKMPCFRILEYGSSGSLVSTTRPTGSTSTDRMSASDLAISSSGYTLCGSFKGTDTLGNITLTSACTGSSCSDLYIVKYAASARPAPGQEENAPFVNGTVAYPNPVSDILNVSTKDGSNLGFLQLYDFTGRKVLGTQIDDKQGQISLSQLPAGTYYLKTEHEKSVIRILKIN